MAWIKFEHATLDKLEVYVIAERLKMKPEQAIGHLLRFWCWCDQQSGDGALAGATEAVVDRVSNAKGFGQALVAAGWLRKEQDHLLIPKFDRHNSESAKKRAEAALRKFRSRTKAPQEKANESRDGHNDVTKNCDNSVTKTRPEKRREEYNLSIVSPAPSGSAVEERIQADVERVCRVLGRRALLSYEAMAAMAELSPIPAEEFDAIEWYYGFPKDDTVQELKIRRQSVDKLVLHWMEEVDKARNYAKTLGISFSENARKKKNGAPGGYPAGGRTWASRQGASELPERWSELPDYLRGEWVRMTDAEKNGWAELEASA